VADGQAEVTYPDGRVRKVKNLGWLLKHHLEVEVIHLDTYETPSGPGRMRVDLRRNRLYEIGWESPVLMLAWVDRPVLQGALANINGTMVIVGKLSQGWRRAFGLLTPP
jgi:hypothetical protein